MASDEFARSTPTSSSTDVGDLLAAIGVMLDEKILVKLNALKEATAMGFSDLNSAIQALTDEDTELAADVVNVRTAVDGQAASISGLQAQVAALTAQVNGGTNVTPDQLAALQQISDDLASDHAAIAAALPAPAPAPVDVPAPVDTPAPVDVPVDTPAPTDTGSTSSTDTTDTTPADPGTTTDAPVVDTPDATPSA